MTLAELDQRIDGAALKAGRPLEGHARFEVEWHKKFAIPVACLVFGLLGLGLSLGSRKEARSAAFGLSIVVIFVYYVFIRLGEQAGDTGLLPPLLAMWAANIVLGAVALVLLVLNHREAAFDPLDPRHYTAWLPASGCDARRARAARRPGARPRMPDRRGGAARRGGRAHPPLPIRFPGILDRYIGRQYLGHLALVLAGVLLALRPGRVHGPVRRHPAEPRQGQGGACTTTPSTVAEIVHLLAPVAVLVSDAHHLRHPEPPQRDHGHEGERHQRLPRDAAGGRAGGLRQPPLFGMRRVRAALHEPRREQGLQRHQGPAAAVVEPARPALDPGQRQPLLQLRLPLRGQVARGRGRGPGAHGLLALRPARLRRRSRDLAHARRALRRRRRSGTAEAYDLERGWRRRSSPRPGFKTFDAGTHPRPRAAQLLQPRGAALGHHDASPSCGAHIATPRGPGLRRHPEAAGPAAPQAGLPRWSRW